MHRRTVVLSIGLLVCVLPLGCDPGTSLQDQQEEPNDPFVPITCEAGMVRYKEECLPVPTIKVDTVGYVRGRCKLATVGSQDSATGFELRDAKTEDAVYSGDLSEPRESPDTGETVRLADFTAFDESGRYVLVVDGVGASPAFRIAEAPYNEVLRTVLLGFYGQRCGVEVTIEHDGESFHHGACHTEDARTEYLERDVSSWDQDGKNGAGGWHDAGDYGKYTINAAFSVAFLLKAWEDYGDVLRGVEHIPDHDGELPPWLDEARFQLDQLLSMQLPDGSASHMIGPAVFPAAPVPPAGQSSHPNVAPFPDNVLPERDTTRRAFSGPGTVATAALAAVTAQAARIFRPIDAEYAEVCLQAARRAYDCLGDDSELPGVPNLNGFTHDAYGSQGDADDRLWAEVELWRATQDESLLTSIEAQLSTMTVSPNWDWANLDPLPAFEYAEANEPGRDEAVVAAVTAAIQSSAQTLVEGTAAHAYGRGIGPMYYWGSNGVMARSVMNLLVANRLAPDEAYLDAALQQIDYLLGRNPFGRTMVTGVGYLPAMSPHHRPSFGDDIRSPWPGLLVGGPNPNQHPLAVSQPDRPPGMFWFDEGGDYTTNEVAVNWNAALAYALAGFYR